MNMPLVLLNRRRRGNVFTPSGLFALAEPGVWYDPSDLNTLFQDAAGTTPVTSAGQPVGRILDKSGRGNHATQATAASRPTYGVVPQGGRRNLLTFTEQFDNAAWTNGNTTDVADQGVAPNGTTTADLVYPTSTGTLREIYSALQTLTGTHTLSVYVKSSGFRWVYLSFTAGIAGITTGSFFDVIDGVVGTNGLTYNETVTPVGNGWFRISVTIDSTATNRRFNLGLADANNSFTATTSGTSGVLIWGAQLETGSTATAYQRVTTAFDVTEAGVQSLSYLSFDGVDDFLVTPTITPNIDKAQVFAGVRKLSDAAASIVSEHSATTTPNAGAFYVAAPENTTTVRYGSLSRGSAATAATLRADITTGAAPDTAVITATHDIAGDLSTIRRNGVAGTNGTGDKGAGNFLAYPIYIGRRGGTTLPFNGQIYSLITRFGANLDANTISQTETWVNSKTGAY